MRIGELVQRSLDQGHNLRSLAQTAAKGGYSIGHQTFQTLRVERIRAFPDPDTIRGLAYTLNVPVATVIRSVAETLDLPMDPPRSALAEVLPPDTGRLTDRQVAAVRALIVSMVSPVGGNDQANP